MRGSKFDKNINTLNEYKKVCNHYKEIVQYGIKYGFIDDNNFDDIISDYSYLSNYYNNLCNLFKNFCIDNNCLELIDIVNFNIYKKDNNRIIGMSYTKNINNKKHLLDEYNKCYVSIVNINNHLKNKPIITNKSLDNCDNLYGRFLSSLDINDDKINVFKDYFYDPKILIFKIKLHKLVKLLPYINNNIKDIQLIISKYNLVNKFIEENKDYLKYVSIENEKCEDISELYYNWEKKYNSDIRKIKEISKHLCIEKNIDYEDLKFGTIVSVISPKTIDIMICKQKNNKILCKSKKNK